jgi:hypothetical protein
MGNGALALWPQATAPILDSTIASADLWPLSDPPDRSRLNLTPLGRPRAHRAGYTLAEVSILAVSTAINVSIYVR